MRSRILVSIELAAALSLTVVVVTGLRVRGNQDSSLRNKYIPIAVEQLSQDDGLFPVWIQCEQAHLTAPNTLNDFSCSALNNTNKSISALAATFSIFTQNKEGRQSRNTSILYFDSLIHPDVRHTRRLKLKLPGAIHIFRLPGPITYEEESITKIEFKIDHVEFDDGTSINPNSDGFRVINSVRRGAALYKAWLVKQFRLHNEKIDTVALMLEDADIPSELRGNANSDEGVRIYRKVLLGLYQEQGATELRKVLSK